MELRGANGGDSGRWDVGISAVRRPRWPAGKGYSGAPWVLSCPAARRGVTVGL